MTADTSVASKPFSYISKRTVLDAKRVMNSYLGTNDEDCTMCKADKASDGIL